MGSESHGRLAALRRLLRERRVATQARLVELLAAEGYAVTQATLSRDLQRLGAQRRREPSGETSYELADGAPSGGAFRLITGVEAGAAMLVVRTVEGAAPVVAAALDAARVPGALGTLAGDDTIFVVPAKGTSADELRRVVIASWKQGEDAE